MVGPVDPLVVEAIDALGRRHLLIPGRLNKVFDAFTSRLLPRRRAVVTNGDFMARGLGRDRSRPFVGPRSGDGPGERDWW
jgi:hypothetical protein